MSDSHPSVSVIMSVYNNAPYLKESVESILHQTFRDFEFLIIDDCSTDGSREILSDLAGYDSRITLIINQVNKGLTKNLNRLVALSQGKFIARFDGDDISLPERLMLSYDYLEMNPSASLICTGVEIIEENGTTICKKWTPSNGSAIWSRLPQSNYVTHPSVMGKSEVFKTNPYDETYRTGQDRNLWIRLKEQGYELHLLPETLLKYRLNPNSVRKIWNNGDDYNYFLACVCFNNHRKLTALSYLQGIERKNLLNFFMRFFVPVSVIEKRRLKRRAIS